ncbi:MAG TPA: HBL/NHE enterotoxin family protein [Mycobacteriales bacterium]|jgi:hypothetical protein
MSTTTTATPATSSVSATVRDIVSPGLLVQAYASMVEKALPFDVDVMNNLLNRMTSDEQAAMRPAIDALGAANTHLLSAQGNARTWRTDILPSMFDTNAAIQSYGVVYNKVLNDVESKLAGLGPVPTPAQIDAFLTKTIAELKAVQTVVGSKATTAATLRDKLNTFVTAVTQDHTNFGQDQGVITSVVTGDQGILTSLQQEIDACHAAIKTDTGLIAGGSVAMLVGIGLCVAGGLVVAGTLGGGTAVGAALIVGGIVVAGGGVAMTTLGGLDLEKKQTLLATDMTQLSLVNAAVAGFNSDAALLQNMAEAAASARDAASSLAAMWDDERSKLQAAVAGLQDAIDDSTVDGLAILNVFLDAAKDDWAPVAEVCELIDTALTGVSTNVHDITTEVSLGSAA